MMTENDPLLFFIPGGPWISGQYWDQYIKEAKLPYKTYRHTLLNHEGRYKAGYSCNFNDVVHDLCDVVSLQPNNNICVIGHSFGAWVGLKALEILPQKIGRLFLVNMPVSNLRSPEMEIKLQSCHKKLETNEDFTAFFEEISCFYFHDSQSINFKGLFTTSFMVGNEGMLLSNEKISSIISGIKAQNYKIKSINCSEDKVIGDSFKSIRTSKDIIFRGSHFPMLEDSAFFTNTLINELH